MSKPALGRGLSVLLGGATARQTASLGPLPAAGSGPAQTGSGVDGAAGIRRISLARIRPCSFQPRKEFSAESLQELADSIRQQGILQPLVVRPASGDGFELIAGERRWRAAQLAELIEVPVIVREVDDRTALELALVENLQRENLNPIEEAHGFAQLVEQFELSQEAAAAKVGKSRAAVANALRLLRLAPEVQAFVRSGAISVGHAKVILGLDSPSQQIAAAHRVLKDQLNVRQAEVLVDRLRSASARTRTPPTSEGGTRDPNLSALEAKLQERLGTRVNLRYRQGKGALEIRFFSDDDLERVLGLLGIAND
jgi:ParB family chromosome partitioning protein